MDTFFVGGGGGRGSLQNWTIFGVFSMLILEQNENLFWVFYNLKDFLVYVIFLIFFAQPVDAGFEPTNEEKLRATPSWDEII